MTLLQGLVAGGAAVYLQNRLQQEAVEKNADCWPTVALQVNHLLLLTAETLCSAGCQLGAFKTFVQAAYILTPLSLIAPLAALVERTSNLALSPSQANVVNTIYRIGVFYISFSALALGDPLFGLGSLALLAIDPITSGKEHEIFVHLAKISALFAFIGYGAQVFCSAFSQTPPQFMRIAAVGSTVLMGFKLCFVDPIVSLHSMMPESGGIGSSSYRYPIYIRDHSASHYDHTPSSSFSGGGGGNLFCRASVW